MYLVRKERIKEHVVLVINQWMVQEKMNKRVDVVALHQIR
jgi:hypothetical protein